MKSSLPSGTVTFCFTDIEGSTKAFAKLGPRFLDVLEEHRRESAWARGYATGLDQVLIDAS